MRKLIVVNMTETWSSVSWDNTHLLRSARSRSSGSGTFSEFIILLIISAGRHPDLDTHK